MSAKRNKNDDLFYEWPLWLSLSSAARYIDRSPDSISRRAIAWPKVGGEYTPVGEFIRHKVRYRDLVMDLGGEEERRYYRPDLDQWLSAGE